MGPASNVSFVKAKIAVKTNFFKAVIMSLVEAKITVITQEVR